MKLDILVLASHPDDAELCIGGTIASLVAKGKKTGIVDLTQGEMGSRGTPELRMKEAERASEILGISYRRNLHIPDTQIHNNRENQLKVIREVRKTRPHVCLIGAPDDRHPDHGYGTELVADALFYSGLVKIESEADGETQQPWRPKHILHYMQDRPIEPDFIYDIGSFMETKKKAVLAYASQFNIENPGDEPETYISSSAFFNQMEARCRYFGHLGGFEFGEPLQYHNKPIPLSSLDTFFESNPKR